MPDDQHHRVLRALGVRRPSVPQPLGRRAVIRCTPGAKALGKEMSDQRRPELVEVAVRIPAKLHRQQPVALLVPIERVSVAAPARGRCRGECGHVPAREEHADHEFTKDVAPRLAPARRQPAGSSTAGQPPAAPRSRSISPDAAPARLTPAIWRRRRRPPANHREAATPRRPGRPRRERTRAPARPGALGPTRRRAAARPAKAWRRRLGRRAHSAYCRPAIVASPSTSAREASDAS